MSLDLIAGLLIGGGLGALVAWNAGIKEGLRRSASRWSSRRAIP
jgi:hypothetical protein